MTNNTFDFYDKTSLKSYNLDESMRYQLNMLGNLDVFTRKTLRKCSKYNLSFMRTTSL